MPHPVGSIRPSAAFAAMAASTALPPARSTSSAIWVASGWLVAAMPFFAIDPTAKLVCNPGNDGSVFVEAPDLGDTWTLRASMPVVQVVAAAASPNLEEVEEIEEPLKETPAPAPVAAAALPALNMPVSSTLKRHRAAGDDGRTVHEVVNRVNVRAEGQVYMVEEAGAIGLLGILQLVDEAGQEL